MKCWKGTALNSIGPKERVIHISFDREDEKALVNILKNVGIEIEVRRYDR